MLYEAERHELLTASAWNEQAARACINEILDDAVDKFSARDLWPSHPLDSFSPDARWNLYIGAAGTIWALRHLSWKPDSLPDFSSVLPGLIEPNRSWILNVKGAGLDLRTAGLLTADTGILLVQAMVNGVETVAAQLGTAIDTNRDNTVCELMWGPPGTMLASLWLYEWTGQGIWAERFRRDANLLWNKFEFVAEVGCHLWVQNLYGHKAPHIGAVHGFAGNAFAVLRGWHLLSELRAIALGGQAGRIAPSDSSVGRQLRDLAAIHRPTSSGAQSPAGSALSRGSWYRELLCRLPRPRYRRSSDGRRRTHLADRTAAQGTGPLSRHRGKWLCVPEAFPAHGRAALARSRPPLRHACHRAASTRYGKIWSATLPTVDR